MIQNYIQTPQLRRQYCEQLMKIKQIQTLPEGEKVPGQETEPFQEIGAVHFEVSPLKYKLCVYRQPAVGQRKAILVLVHGLNGHTGRGAHIAQQFSKEGIEVIGFDQRGFGKSEGPKGYIESLDQLIQDFDEFYKQIIVEKYKYHECGTPMFLSGLSLGGLISYNIGLRYPDRFKGILLYSPALSPFPTMKKILYYLAISLGKLLPRANFIASGEWNSNRYQPAEMSIRNDPLQFNENSYFSSLATVVSGLYNSSTNFNQFKCPFLCVMGEHEKVVDPFVGFDLVEKSTSTDKTVKYFKNSWHNLWQEPEIYEINQLAIEWIQNRLN